MHTIVKGISVQVRFEVENTVATVETRVNDAMLPGMDFSRYS